MRPMRKALAGVALVSATLVGGAIGASLVGTASAQTTTTTPSDSGSGSGSTDNGAAATPDKDNCPLDANGNPVRPSTARSTSTPAT